MGKLVIKYQGRSVGEVNLKLGDMKIGRKPSCDIVLEDKGVSAEHAVITTVGMKSTIQDLDSTNGTYIENTRVKRHELKHGETIVISDHALTYREDVSLDAPAKPALGGRPGAAPATDADPKTIVLAPFAQLLTIDGKDKRKGVPLVKPETTIDNPGKSPARILRVDDGYVVHASMGPGEPRLNDKPVPPGGQLLEDGDIIEVAGTKYRFCGTK